MKVTLFKPYRKKETINRIDAAQVAGIIQKGLLEKSVLRVRELYNLIRTQRLPDGQIECNLEGGIRLPRVCFAAEFENRNRERRMVGYNGLVVIELNDLKSYDEAIAIREKAKRLPFTMMVFLGGSGRSVKIVCRGALFHDASTGPEPPTLQLPAEEDDIRMFQAPNEIPVSDSIDRFSVQMILVFSVYLATYLLIRGPTSLIGTLAPGLGDTVNTLLWGFNFILGSALAMLVS